MNQDLGKLIRFLRKRAGISQATLAQHLYVEQSSISRWENGNSQIDISDLQNLAKEFGLPVESFYQPLHTIETLKGISIPEDIEPSSENVPLENTTSYIDIFSAKNVDTPGDIPAYNSLDKENHTVQSYKVPLYLKLIIITMTFIIFILGYIIYKQNMTYSPPSYLIVNERYQHDSIHHEDVYEVAIVYDGIITERVLNELVNDFTIFWLSHTPERKDISILKVYIYTNEDTALQWGDSKKTFYILNRNKED